MQKIDEAEMRILRWICGKTRKDKIRNGRFQENLGVTSIEDKIRETLLRWFGHIQHRPTTALVMKSSTMQVDGPLRGKGRPKWTWMEVVKINFKKCSLSKDLVRDKLE